MVYLFRQGNCVAYQSAIKGGVSCLQVAGDIACIGGAGGIVKCLNVRTLAVTMAFRTSFGNPSAGVGGDAAVTVSGNTASAVARVRGSAGSASLAAAPLGADYDSGAVGIIGLSVVGTGSRGGQYAIVAGAGGRCVKVDFSKAEAAPKPSSAQARTAAKERTGISSTPTGPSSGVSTLFFYHTGELWGLCSGT